MNTIVFVEDDPGVGSLTAAHLTRHDIEVILEPCGDLTKEKILHIQPSLALLNTMLPGEGGMTICRNLYGRWQGPIVLLTSLDSDMSHILTLGMGVCDHILKTTPPAVLLARLRLHLRQNEHSAQSRGIQAAIIAPHTALRLGILTIDSTNRSVLPGGEQISFFTTGFELLWGSAIHTGQTMDRDVLLENLRDVSYDGMDRSVDVVISCLRKEPLDNVTKSCRIRTVRSKGYLSAPHTWGDESQK